jgi:HAD superfamily hydrolase (TIGR01509 family)
VELYGELLAIAGGKERIRHYMQTHASTFSRQQDFRQALTPFIAALHETKSCYYQQLLTLGVIPPRPGVRRLIKEARRAGLRLAIATTSALPNTLALLKTVIDPESPNWFEVIAAGDVVDRKKPAPDIYKYVLEQLKLSPDCCWVFEDSEQGLMAARQAGLPVIVTPHLYTQQQNFKSAQLILTHLGEAQQPCTIIGSQIDELPEFQQLTVAVLQQLSHLIQP